MRARRAIDRRATAAALYQQAEVHRLKGEFAAAEEAYRGASQLGLEPQPGLALLRLVQGRSDVAATAIRRVASTTANRLKRMGLLPAYIEIVLAAGDVEDARDACRELEDIARSFDTGVPDAIAAQARGAVDLAEGDAQAALVSLRRAFEVWQRIEAPYAAARVRVLIGLACRALGDEDGAGLEIGAARSVFERLGATPDIARINALTKGASVAMHRLTPRELEVLRLVAAGETNKAIAAGSPEARRRSTGTSATSSPSSMSLAGRGDGFCVPTQADLTSSVRLAPSGRRAGRGFRAQPREPFACKRLSGGLELASDFRTRRDERESHWAVARSRRSGSIRTSRRTRAPRPAMNCIW